MGPCPNTTAPHQTALTSVNMPRRVPDPQIRSLKPTLPLEYGG